MENAGCSPPYMACGPRTLFNSSRIYQFFGFLDQGPSVGGCGICNRFVFQNVILTNFLFLPHWYIFRFKRLFVSVTSASFTYDIQVSTFVRQSAVKLYGGSPHEPAKEPSNNNLELKIGRGLTKTYKT